MFASGSQLAQARPANTNTATLFTATMRTEITKIVVCNTTGNTESFYIYHDDDGTTYDQTTALFYGVTIMPATTTIIDSSAEGFGFQVSDVGTIGIKTSTASALTFTLYGATEVRGAR